MSLKALIPRVTARPARLVLRVLIPLVEFPLFTILLHLALFLCCFLIRNQSPDRGFELQYEGIIGKDILSELRDDGRVPVGGLTRVKTSPIFFSSTRKSSRSLSLGFSAVSLAKASTYVANGER